VEFAVTVMFSVIQLVGLVGAVAWAFRASRRDTLQLLELNGVWRRSPAAALEKLAPKE